MNISDRDIENRVKGSIFSNPSHKERLRSKLLEQSKLLREDDLDGVTGGNIVPPSNYRDWDWMGDGWDWNLPEDDPSLTKKDPIFPGTIANHKKRKTVP